jgi:PAS domain S-box-containing protein
MTILATQAVVQYDLDQQNEDAKLINMAGRQRMLGQRLSKLTLYIQNSVNRSGRPDPRFHHVDTLKKIAEQLAFAHRALANRSNKPRIDSLIQLASAEVDPILAASRQIVQRQDTATVNAAVRVITDREYRFLELMDGTVNSFQRDAEEKLSYIKWVEIILGAGALIVLVLEFIFFFRPVLDKLRASNTKLAKLNRKLTTANDQMVASEEEIKANLEQISALSDDLEVRERQYRLMVDNAVDMIYELDDQGRFSFVNPTMIMGTGYSREELIGKQYWDLVDINDRRFVVKFYEDQRNNKTETTLLNFRIQHKNGVVTWVSQNVRFYFEGDWVVKVSVVARDITSLKAAEAKLEASERLFRELTENAPVGIYLSDPMGNATYANKRWSQLSGIPEHEIKTRNWMEIVHPDDIQKVIPEFEASVRENREFMLEFRFLNPSGTRWVNARATALYNESGEMTGLIATTLDITALKEAQQKLLESEKLYRLISHNSKDLITLYTASEDPKRIFVSPSSKEILGYEPEELIGRSPFDIMVKEDAELLKKKTHTVTMSGKPGFGEYRVIRKDGRTIWLESNSQPFFDDNGKMTGFQTSARDVTERKEFELELINARDNAESATRAKSQFLSMMSHEIRTPMNAIIGLSNLLLEDDPRPDQSENLELLRFSGQNLLSILNDILDFSKIEADKVHLEKVDFDLKDCLTKIVKMMETRAEDKGIDVRFIFDDSLPRAVKGDPVRLSQIVNNLLSNAIKFTENGSVTFTVAAEGKAPDGFSSIGFRIKDTGIGIPSDKIHLIFESFSQAASDTTRKFGGTGLGLTITRRLIRLMGSDITLASEHGKGSEFHFVLQMENGQVVEKPVAKTTDGLQTLLKTKPLHILLVEDNRVNQVVATNFLKRWGVTFTIANNGLEAVELIRKRPYDLVFMDLQMPEMDGYQATSTIRAMPETHYKTIPIIALTASAMMSIREKVIEHGMTDFLSKPFQPVDLQNIIIRYGFPDHQPTETSELTSKLDLYADGNDDFRLELISLVTRNVEELRESLQQAITTHEADHFDRAAHKCKTALSMLGDIELLDLVKEISASLNSNGQVNVSASLLQRFESVTKVILTGLSKELGNVRTGS